eukprot:186756-Prymnesium_polylepis.2
MELRRVNRRLDLCVGQRVLITVNKRSVHADFANAVLATISRIDTNPHTGEPAVVFVCPEGWGGCETHSTGNPSSSC